MRPSLAVVLAHELVNDKVPSGSANKLLEPLLRNKTRIRAEYVKLSIQQRRQEPQRRPWRYARVNPLVMGLEECIAQLEAAGFRHNTGAAEEEGSSFVQDGDVAGLLVFPPGTDLAGLELYKRGALVLQDKASCLPVVILDPPVGSTVLDACAAPGNKTTQLAASVGHGGRVYAFERDPRRVLTLRATLAKHGCESIARAECMDFLRTSPEAYGDVEYALVDPSCSGSGILEDYEVSQRDDETSSGKDRLAERLKSLSNFQCMIVRHAMSCKGCRLTTWCRIMLADYSISSIHQASSLFYLLRAPGGE